MTFESLSIIGADEKRILHNIIVYSWLVVYHPGCMPKKYGEHMNKHCYKSWASAGAMSAENPQHPAPMCPSDVLARPSKGLEVHPGPP